jgi:curved DNA-binding protein CbpA
MSDYFALMNFPRTPWLDAGEVQARFLELSAAAHPDRVHNLGATETATANQKFSELNVAASVLRDHKQRVQHLLALEMGAAPAATQNIPDELIDLFAPVGQTCRKVDEFLTERARAASPMLQAQLFAKGLEWSDAVSELQQQVGVVKTKAEDELKRFAKDWPARKPVEELAALAHQFAMISRWESQLQERFARLASS